MEQQREHAVASLKANTEIQKLDISLTHLRQSFDQFRLQLVRTYDSIMTRLTRPDVEPLTAAERLYDETQKSAMQGYFRLSDDGDTLVADAQQLLGTLSSISKQMSLMDAT